MSSDRYKFDPWNYGRVAPEEPGAPEEYPPHGDLTIATDGDTPAPLEQPQTAAAENVEKGE